MRKYLPLAFGLFLLTLILWAVIGGRAEASTHNPADARQLAASLSAAQPGDIINIAPSGTYGRATIARKWSPPITINAGTANVLWNIKGASGIIFNGGIVQGALGSGPAGYGISAILSDNLTFKGVVFKNNQRAIVFDRSHHFTFDGNDLSGMRIDGIDVAAGSHDFVITNNKCYAFNTGTTHPDCIQGWSRPGLIVYNGLVAGNSSTGDNQGIFFGNHIRNGINDGGFDNITIDHNYVEGLNWPRGITLADCRKCAVTNNVTKRLPGAPHVISITWPGSTGVFTGNVQGK